MVIVVVVSLLLFRNQPVDNTHTCNRQTGATTKERERERGATAAVAIQALYRGDGDEWVGVVGLAVCASVVGNGNIVVGSEVPGKLFVLCEKE